MHNVRGYFFIIGATVFWGVSATVAKFLFTQNISPIVLVQMRMTVSCFVIVVAFLLYDRSVFRIAIKDLPRFAILGIVGIAGSNFTYYYIIHATNVATGILIQYMAPLIVLGYAVLTRDEEINFVKFLAAIVSLAGCYLAVSGERISFHNLSEFGIAMCVASPVVWAINNIVLRQILNSYRVWTVTIYAFIFGTLFWFFLIPPWKIIEVDYPLKTWEIFFAVGMISVLIPHSLYFIGAQHLTASRAIITATFEPVVAIGSAFFFLGELLTPVQIAGAAIVISAIVILQYKPETAPIIIVRGTDQAKSS